MSFKEFAKRYWFGIMLAVITIAASFIVGHYFYKKSISSPEPVFLLDPVRTKIIESNRLVDTPLRVVRANGDEIKGNVTSVRFYFWNNGRKSIKKSNILEPLVITLDDPNGEILDYKILKLSRKVVKPVVSLNSVDPNKSLLLSFAILEQGDGLTGQVIYRGEPEGKLVICGTIEGVRKILDNASVIQRDWPKEFIKEIVIIIFATGFGILFLHFYSKRIRERAKQAKPTQTKPTKTDEMTPMSWCIGVLTMAIILIIISLLMHKVKIEEAKTKALTSIIQKVPKDIIP